MNVYDFDNTIFKGDSSIKFILYSFIRHPFLVLGSLIKSLKEIVKYIFKKSDLGLIKSDMFSFVKHIDNLDNYVNKFIVKYKKNIKEFYLKSQKEDDLVISASFDFIIKPFCEYLGIHNVIATKYDVKNGKIIGKNCKGEEKVKRFKEIYQDKVVLNAYSDSLSDVPMLKMAKNAYLVKNEQIIKYEK